MIISDRGDGQENNKQTEKNHYDSTWSELNVETVTKSADLELRIAEIKFVVANLGCQAEINPK